MIEVKQSFDGKFLVFINNEMVFIGDIIECKAWIDLYNDTTVKIIKYGDW